MLALAIRRMPRAVSSSEFRAVAEPLDRGRDEPFVERHPAAHERGGADRPVTRFASVSVASVPPRP